MVLFFAILVNYFSLIDLALNLARNNFSPSLLLALDDPILPYPFLKLCLDSYTGKMGDFANPYVSPYFASDEVLK